jgi:NhaP-type Na+/H+ or K+/H+ antiporter
MWTCSFRIFSSLSGSRGVLSDFFLLFLFLGLVDGPLLFALNGELKRSLILIISLLISYVVVSSLIVANASVPPELIDTPCAYKCLKFSRI